MATPNKVRGGLTVAAHVFAVIFVSVLGIGAVTWGALMLPLFWQQVPLNRATSAVLEGRTFNVQWLLDKAQQAAVADGHSWVCNPTTPHDAVVLRLAALEEAITAANQTQVGLAYDPLYDATRTALACSPADPFVWLTLFWLEVGKHGYDPAYENYLRLSYALGPNEGWIALWRSRISFAVFERLPDDLASHAINEFTTLVETGRLYPETLAIFSNATPATQNRIVERLKTAKAIPRQVFGRMLYDQGLNITIPGVDATPTRPWR
jgi:hypothetical protein